MTDPAPTAPPAPLPDPDALAALEEQRAFLRRSLDDLERERAAGDLDDADFEALRDDYTRRLAAVAAAVEEGHASFRDARPGGTSRRTLLIGAAVLVFALGCGLVVAQLAGRRNPTAEISGATQSTAASALRECLAGLTEGAGATTAASVQCYDKVLQKDPTNVEALTYKAGIQLMADGDLNQIGALIDVASAHPEYPDVHAFLAVAFSRLGRDDSALAELNKLTALNPSPFITDLVAPLRQSLEATTTSSSGP